VLHIRRFLVGACDDRWLTARSSESQIEELFIVCGSPTVSPSQKVRSARP
jgi:hypothetical protein